MYLNKKNLFLVISICLIFFFLTYFDVKSKEIKIIDGDTIHLNGEKIRFSGIDTPEIEQTCIKNNEVIKCGIKAKELLIKVIGNKKINCVRDGPALIPEGDNRKREYYIYGFKHTEEEWKIAKRSGKGLPWYKDPRFKARSAG